ncbi:hypothetical protein ES703_85686 [subsurface metagenome]
MVSEKKEYICDICGKELTTLPGLNGHRQFAHGQAKHMLADTPEAAIVELLSELTGAFSRIEAGAEAQAERVKHLEAVLAEVDKRLDGFKSDLLERLESEQAGHEQAEKRASRAEELAGSHPAPDDKLLEAWENCANCRPKLRDFCNQLHHTLYPLGVFMDKHVKDWATEQAEVEGSEIEEEVVAEVDEEPEKRTSGGYFSGSKWDPVRELYVEQ